MIYYVEFKGGTKVKYTNIKDAFDFHFKMKSLGIETNITYNDLSKRMEKVNVKPY